MVQYEPVTQSRQAVALSASWNVPAAHVVHTSWPGRSLYVPALQLVSTALPTGHRVPIPHPTQFCLAVITAIDMFLRVPAGHGSGAADPTAQ